MHTPHSVQPRRRKQGLFTPLFLVFNLFWGSLRPLRHAFTPFSLLVSPLFVTLFPVLTPFYTFLARFYAFLSPLLPRFVSFTVYFRFLDPFDAVLEPFYGLPLKRFYRF